MPDHLTKTEIVAALVEAELGKAGQISNILSGLAQLAADEVAEGHDFLVPGIAKISWRYRSAAGKGARWKKGQLVQGFGGVEEVKESDSPPITAKARLVASPVGGVGKNKPKTDASLHAAFLKSAAGKAIAKRLGK